MPLCQHHPVVPYVVFIRLLYALSAACGCACCCRLAQVQQQLCQLGMALLHEPLTRLAAIKGRPRHPSSGRAGGRVQPGTEHQQCLQDLLPFAAVAVKAKCGVYWRFDDLQADIVAAADQVRQVAQSCQVVGIHSICN